MSDAATVEQPTVPWFRVVRIAFFGLWMVSVLFALPILASALIAFARLTFYPDLISGGVGALAVTAGVVGLWLFADWMARRPKLAANPRLVHALAWVIGLDLAFWAIVPAASGLPLALCLSFGVGAAAGTAVYFFGIRRARRAVRTPISA